LQIFTDFEFDGTGATKDRESWGMLKITCLENSTDEHVNWKQVSVMIGYKISIPKRLCHSQSRMGRGSPLCGELREQIAQQFRNNSVQHWQKCK
jgi:hypothetical protein